MLETTISKNVFLGDGVATAFAFNFRVWETTELSVVVTSPAGVTAPATGWTAELTESGGTVTYLHNGAPLPDGWKLAIMRDMPFVQEVDLITGTRFDPEVVETALDVATAERQQLLERLGRAIVVEPTDEDGPEALLADIRDARTASAASAVSAQANANAAAESARSAAGSAAIATEAREAACICASEAEAARDVAIAQTEAANELMEAELGKVNAIVAANRTDQQAAVSAARQWAEKAPDTPVDYDEEGKPRYSARHWAENAQKIALEPPTAERRGAIRVGDGLMLATGENGETDVLAVSPDGITAEVNEGGLLSALGGNLLANSEEWITASGQWIAKAKGWHEVLLINGGKGGYVNTVSTTRLSTGGSSGAFDSFLLYLEAGESVAVTIGAGSTGVVTSSSGTFPAAGGITSFGGISPRFNNAHAAHPIQAIAADRTSESPGSGPGGGIGSANPNPGNFYGAGGGAFYSTGNPRAGAGHQGAVRARWHDPAKAAGPQPALFSVRRMAARVADGQATVNLYDPETGQGSVWREEDAPAKLAEGMITEEAWQEICAERAAEAHAAWLADPATVDERFAMLRAAREVKLADYDVAVAELRRKERAGADVAAALAAWDAYAEALCDLPAQEGAPWDGGGEGTPWPALPAFLQPQEN